MKTCHETGKKCHANKHEAERHRWHLIDKSIDEANDLHSYVCPACRCWHVGHYTVRQQRRRGRIA